MAEENEALPTIDDTMGAVFDEMATDTAATDAATDTAVTSTPASDRDERGRFTKRDAAPGATADTTAQDTVTEQVAETTDQGTETAGKPADGQPLAPPERWSAEDKAAFAALPRQAQSLVLKRESDVQAHLTKETQKLSEQSRRFEQLEQIVAPRRQGWAMQGMTEAQAFTTLLALSDFANRDTPGFLRHIAKSKGIDLTALNQPAESQADPALSPLTQRLDHIEQSIAQRERDEQVRLQQAEQARLDTFAKDPKHPHFEEVRVHMAALLRQGVAKDLDDAYEQAVYANPSVRTKVLAEQSAAQEAKRMEEAKAAAAKARKSAGTNLQPKGSLPGTRTSRSMDDTMSEAFDRAQGAA